ncbi:MAG: biotin--[acetyl-CoA-carboxylase] ligase [Candidatus Methanosuratus sp.]|nr:biotin--[acetyl-CoA-carboxylase] ligase [Candidatus Methanosuratincola sp.]
MERLLIEGEFFSGSVVASQIGVSRAAVSKQIARLRRHGYDIESVRGKGYRLVPRFDSLLPLEVLSRLRTRTLGRNPVLLETVDSTQNYLRRLAGQGADEGTIVVALEQKSGKGRASRQWSSPPGGLWFSLLLRPSMPMHHVSLLTLLSGVAVARALMQQGVPAALKWPNDVLVRGKKVCGILLEASSDPERVEYVLVGVGINVNFSASDLPDGISENAVSTLDLLGKKLDRADLLSTILMHMEEMYEKLPSSIGRILEEWRFLSCTLGMHVTVSSYGRTIEGNALDIAQDGSLLVETGEGLERVYSGDVAIKK